MIYDRPIEIAAAGDGESPLSRRLTVLSRHYCAELTIYQRTYFEWAQAGETIDRMVQLPRFGAITATMYAIFESQVYRIAQSQPTRDEDGRDIYILTLRREEARYDVFRA